MKNRKNSILLIIIAVVLVMSLLFGGSLFLLSSMGYVEFKGNSNDKVDEEVENVENDREQEVVKEYNFGDEVILNQLKNYGIFYDEVLDYSQWRVLEDSGEYVKLFYVGDSVWFGKISPLDVNAKLLGEMQKSLEEKGIDFGVLGNVDLLNEADLKLFGCDVETLQCKNTLEWVDMGAFTKVFLGLNEVVSLSGYQDGELSVISSGEYNLDVLLAFTRPTITILKSNLE